MRLITEDIHVSYDKKEVLKGATFTFEQGKIYALLGRNGAGKTTFFNCLNGDLKPSAGTICLEKDSGRAPLSSEQIGYVLSTPVVPEFLTARELLKFYLEINRDRMKHQKTPDEYLDEIQIDPEDRGKLLRDYSHGMKNKIQMLINIMGEPDLLLLDEPLTSLDVVAADEMKKMLLRRKQEHITIFSTHILELALDLCDEVVILHRGVLTLMERAKLDEKEYKEQIIEALKEQDHD